MRAAIETGSRVYTKEADRGGLGRGVVASVFEQNVGMFNGRLMADVWWTGIGGPGRWMIDDLKLCDHVSDVLAPGQAVTVFYENRTIEGEIIFPYESEGEYIGDRGDVAAVKIDGNEYDIEWYLLGF